MSRMKGSSSIIIPLDDQGSRVKRSETRRLFDDVVVVVVVVSYAPMVSLPSA